MLTAHLHLNNTKSEGRADEAWDPSNKAVGAAKRQVLSCDLSVSVASGTAWDGVALLWTQPSSCLCSNTRTLTHSPLERDKTASSC